MAQRKPQISYQCRACGNVQTITVAELFYAMAGRIEPPDGLTIYCHACELPGIIIIRE